MTTKNAMILVGALLGLVTYVYFFEVAGEKKKQAVRQPEFERLKLDSENIERIEFVETGLHVEKNDSHWVITKPLVAKADGIKMNVLLDLIGLIGKERTISDNVADFEKFGVEEFTNGFIFYGKDGHRDSIFIGDTNLERTKVFCRTSNSNNVFLAPNSLSAFSKKTLFDLRDKRLLAFHENEIRKLKIVNEEKTFTCVRDSDNVWWLKGQVKTRCDQKEVSAIISWLKNIKIVKFVDESQGNLAAYHLYSPQLSISVYTENKFSVLHFSERENNRVFVKKERNEPIFEVDSGSLNEFNVSDFLLREKTIVQSLPDSITSENKKEKEAGVNFL